MGAGIRPEREEESGPHAGPTLAAPLEELCGPWAIPHTHMVGESRATKGKRRAGLWGHHAAGSKGVPRARETKEVGAQGKDARCGEAQEHAASAGAAAGPARRVQPGLRLTQTEKADSHSNEAPPPALKGCLQEPLGECLPCRPSHCLQAGQPARLADGQGASFVQGKAQPPLQSRKS